VAGKNFNCEKRQGVYLTFFSSQPANVRAQRVAQASLSCPSGNSPSALPQAASYSRKCLHFRERLRRNLALYKIAKLVIVLIPV
jgi:hypothetical protein